MFSFSLSDTIYLWHSEGKSIKFLSPGVVSRT